MRGYANIRLERESLGRSPWGEGLNHKVGRKARSEMRTFPLFHPCYDPRGYVTFLGGFECSSNVGDFDQFNLWGVRTEENF